MLEHINSWKYKPETLLANIIPSQKSINAFKEKNELIKILQPLKDKIVEMALTKGPISLISSILELYYDKEATILQKEEIFDGIQNKLKHVNIVIYEGYYISYLDNRNFYVKIHCALGFNKCFQKHPSSNKEFITIDIKNVSKYLPSIIAELIELFNILTYSPKISVEIEENNLDYSFIENYKVNNYENGFKFGHPYEKIERSDKKKMIKDFDYDNNYVENNSNIKEIKQQKVKTNLKNNIINTKNKTKKEIINNNSNITNNIKKPEPIKKDLESKENKETEKLKDSIIKIPKETSNTNFINTENNSSYKNEINPNGSTINRKLKKNIKKHFLQRKRYNSFKIPISNEYIENEEKEDKSEIKEIKKEDKDIKDAKDTSEKNKNFNSSLSIFSVSFNCVPKKTEKNTLNHVMDYINTKNHKFIKMFCRESIKDREEKKIKELKQEIYQKNYEIKKRQYLLECWKNANKNENNIIENNPNDTTEKNIEKFIKEFEADAKKINDESEILYAYQFIINRAYRTKTEIDEGIKKSFKNCFDICNDLLKKMKENKKKYYECLKNITDYIKNINSISLNMDKDKGTNNEIHPYQNLLIFKEESEAIEIIMQSIDYYEDTLIKKIYRCLLNTPFEYLTKDVNLDNSPILPKINKL